MFGSEVLFAGEDANRRTGLWVTDGTGAGTSEISVAGADTSGFGLEPAGFTLFGSEVLFSGTDALSQQNLWVTDGTSAGTSELSVANAASVGAGFFRGVVFGSGGSSEVLYASADLNNLGGLWITDGTTAGTSELSVAGLGHAQDSPSNFVAFGGLFLFEGADANGHLYLWQTDGTAGGTSEISVPGASSLGLFDEQSFDDRSLFRSAAKCCLPATIAAARRQSLGHGRNACQNFGAFRDRGRRDRRPLSEITDPVRQRGIVLRPRHGATVRPLGDERHERGNVGAYRRPLSVVFPGNRQPDRSRQQSAVCRLRQSISTAHFGSLTAPAPEPPSLLFPIPKRSRRALAG